MGLRVRLLLLVLLPAIPGLVLAVYTNLKQREAGRFRVELDAIRVVQLAASKQAGLIDATRQQLNGFSKLPEALGTNKPVYQAFFAGVLGLFTNYVDFGLLEINGDVVASSQKSPVTTNLADRAMLERIVRTREFAIGTFEAGEAGARPSLLFGHPVFRANGQVARVLYAALDLNAISRVAAKTELPSNAVIHVLDEDGIILTRYPDPEGWVGKPFGLSNEIARILSRKEGTTETRIPGDVVRLCGFTSLGTAAATNLVVSVGIPLSAAYAQTDRMLLLNMGVLGLVAALAVLAAWIYADRAILKPVRAMAESTRQVTAGDLTGRTGLGHGAGELNQLARAFDAMTERLRQHRLQNEQLHAELEDRVKERTAQLEHSNRELEAFSYSVSHDLRAPLRHIHGNAQRLEEEAGAFLTDEHRRYLKLIATATKRMGSLIDDLLAFSRMGRTELTKSEVNLDELVNEVLQEFKRDTEGRNIEWSIMPLPKVFADRAMLKQVWANLLSNAIKYTRQRHPAVISISGRQEANEFEFAVRDNGAGFDMRYADKLFRVFERLHHADEFDGTGIGLANVRRIILRHHGRTWAEAKPDAGATFYFTLPIQTPAQGESSL
ncbi:MAG: ATP-binding protein [Verrucomicrobiota bacterium]